MSTLERVYEFVEWHLVAFGEAPTIAEVAAEVGRHYSVAATHLNSLVASGRLRRTGSRDRGWEVVSATPPPVLHASIEPTLSGQNRAGCKDVCAIYISLGGEPVGYVGRAAA